VVTEYCVRLAALGLARTGKPVAIVADAVETLDPADSRRTLEEFTAAGGTLTSVAQVCG
jgi:nicotinamidase-related amidase